MGVVVNFKVFLLYCEIVYQWFYEGEIVVLLLLLDGYVLFVWFVYIVYVDVLFVFDLVQFVVEVECVLYGQVGVFECVMLVVGFLLVLQMVDKLIVLCVVLVGDVVYLIYLFVGQGMNLGLCDVVVFVDVIVGKESFCNFGDMVLLCCYECLCWEDICVLMVVIDGLQWLFVVLGFFVKVVCNVGMVFVGVQLFVKCWFVLVVFG